MRADRLFGTMDVSASGMRAEWFRMKVIANNLANAGTTQTPEGGPYKRQMAIFWARPADLDGVHVGGVAVSTRPPRMVYMPGHPDADAKGFVAMPNVQVPMEMVDFVMASRAYEANLTCMRLFKSICEESLKLLR